MLTKSRYYQPRFRINRLQSDSKMMNGRTEQQTYHSPQPSIDAHKMGYRLTPLSSKVTSLSNHFFREEQRVFHNKLSPIDSDISQLQKELDYKRSLKRHLQKSKHQINFTTPYQTSEDQDFRLQRRKTEQSNIDERQGVAIWHNPDIFRSTRKKIKLYKIKPKHAQKLKPMFQNLSDELPVIDKIRLGRTKNNDYLYQIVKTPTTPGKIYTKRRFVFSPQKYRYKGWRRFRKVAHAVLFIIYLRKYNERMRRNRQGYLQSFIREKVKQKLLNLKNFLIEHSQPFFLALISQNDFDYSIHEKDGAELKRQKQRSLKKLIEMELDSLDKCVRMMTNREFFSELFYYLCKHGSYACSYQMFTTEELGLLCISHTYGYISADKHLESSALLSLVFIKILLFNILLQPSKVPIFINYNAKTEIIFKNIRLIATILYELFIDIQDSYLQKADGVFTIGNWKKTRFEMKNSQSMTVKEGFYQKNEVISGLADHKYIRQVYGTRFMIDYKKLVEELVNIMHQNIGEIHLRVREKYF